MKAASLAEWFGSMPVDEAESIKLEFAVAIDNAIKNLNLTRSQVAQVLETSPAWVTKVLRGDINLTIESMAKLCKAVGQDLQIKVVPKNLAVESISVQSVFYMHKYSRPKFAGAYEVDLSGLQDKVLYCNDNEYAHAA